MAFSKSLNPKRKRRVHAVRDSPFPVSIATDQQDTSWFYYTGYLHDDHIEIKHSGDIERLYKMVGIISNPRLAANDVARIFQNGMQLTIRCYLFNDKSDDLRIMYLHYHDQASMLNHLKILIRSNYFMVSFDNLYNPGTNYQNSLNFNLKIFFCYSIIKELLNKNILNMTMKRCVVNVTDCTLTMRKTGNL